MFFEHVHLRIPNDDDDDDDDGDNNNNNNNNSAPESRKYWVDVQRGIVSSHGERNPLWPWLAILLEMVSQ